MTLKYVNSFLHMSKLRLHFEVQLFYLCKHWSYFNGDTVPSILNTPSVAINIILAPDSRASISCFSKAGVKKNEGVTRKTKC